MSRAPKQGCTHYCRMYRFPQQSYASAYKNSAPGAVISKMIPLLQFKQVKHFSGMFDEGLNVSSIRIMRSASQIG